MGEISEVGGEPLGPEGRRKRLKELSAAETTVSNTSNDISKHSEPGSSIKGSMRRGGGDGNKNLAHTGVYKKTEGSQDPLGMNKTSFRKSIEASLRAVDQSRKKKRRKGTSNSKKTSIRGRRKRLAGEGG